jgi:ABC-type hemin transport system substrate-binding protein
LSDTASQQIARKIVVEQMKAKGIKTIYVPDWPTITREARAWLLAHRAEAVESTSGEDGIPSLAELASRKAGQHRHELGLALTLQLPLI